LKRTKIILLSLTIFALGNGESYSSWLIDDAKFHISAHGQSSCQDCHPDLTDEDLHPNPEDVSKNLADFFSVDQCLACHDEIMDDLDSGVHGSEKIDPAEDYEDCLGCHHPHYQLRLAENSAGQFDSSRSIYEQCGACHDPQESLPAFSSEDEKCMACHRYLDRQDPPKKEKISSLCFHCHGNRGTKAQLMTGKRASLIDENNFTSTPHVGVDCRFCHLQAVQFNHGSQKQGDCRQCHTPHDAKKAHDPHTLVACQTCHMEGIIPLRDPESKVVRWEITKTAQVTSPVHNMIRTDDETSCRRCHFKGNHLGAVSMILPAKSILCMPCHAATFSGGDFTTISALAIFLAGLIMTASVWFSGALPGHGNTTLLSKAYLLIIKTVRAVFSSKVIPVSKTLFFDVFLQRRLHRRSVKRWVIHGLIFFPFVFRFVWGILGLFTSIWLPERSIAWSLLDKNNPTVAFLFDLTGIMILLGIIFAFLRDSASRTDHPPGLPGQDRWALGLIGGIVGIGFVLEAMRIAMTGWPAGSGYAVIGYALSKLFSGMSSLVDIYGYVWYIHAVLTGAFIAYLPFSRLMHIIMAPVVLAMNAATDHEHKRV
jgi:nitrate reductase gamma subunit